MQREEEESKPDWSVAWGKKWVDLHQTTGGGARSFSSRKSRRGSGRQSLKLAGHQIYVRKSLFPPLLKSGDAKHARDFARNLGKRKTNVIVRTCYPMRFRPMQEKEYELRVKQQQAERAIAQKVKIETHKKKDRIKSFAAQRQSVRRFLNDQGFRKSISGTYLDNSDAFRRKREEMEESEYDTRSEELIEEEKKIDEDNAWIVKTLEDHDTREDLEHRVIQNMMQDSSLFRSLRIMLRIAEGNKHRHKQTHKKYLGDLEQIWSTKEINKETELGLAQKDMRGRLVDLYRALQAARTSKIPTYPPVSRSETPASMCYWDSDERYKKGSSLEKELLSNLKVTQFKKIRMIKERKQVS